MTNNKSNRKKPHSILSVIIVLIIIFLVLLSGVIFLRYKSGVNLNDLSTKKISLDDNLKKQMDNQRGEKTIQIRLTEDDINKLLGTDAPDFPLKNPTVKITPEKIILSGKTGSSPLSLKVAVGIVPRVDNGKVTFDIKEIKTAGVSAPKVVIDSVNSKLKNYLKQYSPGDDIKVTDLKLYDGYLIITGERNQ